jgi:NAD(P)-dependent dehydrogenase (short-subunit alcohol dehydrogenase family)
METRVRTFPKTWFITGASRGFGRIWTEAALARGDRVAATARDPNALASLQDHFGERLLALRLDVTDRAAAQEAVGKAHAHVGRLDVIVNNAGFGLFGMVEEASEQEARRQMETNFFGALWVTQAAIPLLRAQRCGHLIQVSSIGGVTALPQFGVYNASKWALEGLSQALSAEVRDFGIEVTLVEPTGYATEWSRGSASRAEPIAAYDPLREQITAGWRNFRPGDPQATAHALLALVDAENPPLRAFFGQGLIERIQAEYAERLDTWSKWRSLSEAAMGRFDPAVAPS